MGIIGIGDVVIFLIYSIEQFVGYRAKCMWNLKSFIS